MKKESYIMFIHAPGACKTSPNAKYLMVGPVSAEIFPVFKNQDLFDIRVLDVNDKKNKNVLLKMSLSDFEENYAIKKIDEKYVTEETMESFLQNNFYQPHSLLNATAKFLAQNSSLFKGEKVPSELKEFYKKFKQEFDEAQKEPEPNKSKQP